MQTGTVKWFNRVKGYGFITCDQADTDAFAHVSNIQSDNVKYLEDGQRVTFDVIPNRKGAVAVNIAVIHESEEV